MGMGLNSKLAVHNVHTSCTPPASPLAAPAAPLLLPLPVRGCCYSGQAYTHAHACSHGHLPLWICLLIWVVPSPPMGGAPSQEKVKVGTLIHLRERCALSLIHIHLPPLQGALSLAGRYSLPAPLKRSLAGSMWLDKQQL